MFECARTDWTSSCASLASRAWCGSRELSSVIFFASPDAFDLSGLMYTAFEEAPTDARQESSNARKQRIVGALSLAGLGLLIVAWVRSTIDGPASLALKMASIELKKEISWHPPEAQKRCEWVEAQTVAKQDPNATPEDLAEQYAAQAKDANTFYRATAHLFWQDFVREGWGLYDLRVLGIEASLNDGSPVERTSTWTWVTGDQHLSNFGAWLSLIHI